MYICRVIKTKNIMHTNEKTVKAIRSKCLDLLLKWEILLKEDNDVIVFNPLSKVTIRAIVEQETGKITYKITDQINIIRPKKATVVFYSDGDFYCEYSAFKSEEDILESLNK